MRDTLKTALVVAVLAGQLFTIYVLVRLVAAIETLATVLSMR